MKCQFCYFAWLWGREGLAVHLFSHLGTSWTIFPKLICIRCDCITEVWPMECEWKGYVQLPSLIHRNILCWISASSEPLFTFLPAPCSVRWEPNYQEICQGEFWILVGLSLWEIPRETGGREKSEVRIFVPLAPSCEVALSWLFSSTKDSPRYASPDSPFSLPIPLLSLVSSDPGW